jgi:molybdenum cofactor cytidylyltransferase
MTRVLGIVLAAGRSERMGRPKGLLPAGDRTFLRATVDTLHEGGCDEVVAVVASTELEAEARSAGARAVWNHARGAQQLDSLRVALAAAADDVTGALVHPVDHPLVKPATVAAIIAGHQARPGAVVRPVHEDQPGHPTLFPRPLWQRLLEGSLPHGARSLVEAPGTETSDLHVDDPGVVTDIDTPGDYARHLSGEEAAGRAAGSAVGPAAAARAALDARRGGRPVVVVARADEATDGRRLLVFGDDDYTGTLGDLDLDERARSLAAALLAEPDPSAAEPVATVDASTGVELYAELHRPPGRLFIVGAGHIAVPLARLADLLGFPVVVLDDREEFATATASPLRRRCCA